MHEASLYERNCSITLTYGDEYLEGLSLVHRDFQKFMKRLRKRCSGVRFFMCGEYGEKFSRPHFHACLFNCDFDDRVYSHKSPAGFKLYRSDLLSKLWPFGIALIGELTFESAAYAARYVMKKVGSDGSVREIINPETGEVFSRAHEYCQMSRRPGIGTDWFRLYWPEVVREGQVVVNGVKCSAPKFYRRRMRDLLAYDDVRRAEFEAGLSRMADQTSERLAVRECVAKARISRLKRSI